MKGLQCLKSKSWWNAAAVRGLKTAAQTCVAGLAMTTIWEIDATATIGMALTAAVVSLMTSLAGIPEAEDN